VTGDHSNLYVLDAAKGKCLEVLYVGHEEGTVKVPPVALMNHLFVFENTGSDEALLHVYAMGMNGDRPTGTSLKLAQKDIRLRGNVITPAEIFERRLVVLTDLGEIKVLDVEPGKIDGDKVNLAAEKSTSYSEPTLAKMVLGKSRMWVTGSSIQAYTLEITRGRIPPKWSHSKGDIFIGDAVLFEDTVIAARILKGTETVRVEAYDAKEGTRYWRTDLGAPISMLVSTDGGVHAATTQGALFKLTGEDLRNGSTRAPVENPGKNLINVRFSGPVSMDKGRMVMMNSLGSDIMAIYDPNRRTEKLRTITFPTEGIPSTPAVFAGGGVCVPVRAGRVTLINPNTGGRLGSPFQPPTRPNKPLKWTWPTNVPEDPDSIVVGTETQTLYRLRISDQIRELNSEKIDAKLFGRLAATNSAVFGASAAATGDQLQWYDIASLKQQGKKLLKGRIVFGPSTSGELVLVQTDDNVLRAFNDAGTQSWECKLPAGGLADTPVIVDNQMIATGKRGWVVRISTDNGKVLGQTDLGQPLFGNPLVLNGRMLIPGSEGVVFVDALP
ncbi:MAG: PQQ-binding-like beta-propeller repeat protein, partial [Planctomycetota bacterium]